MQDSILLLHLSDLHFGNKLRYRDADGSRLGNTFHKSVLQVLRQLNVSASVDLVVVTGDITERGRPCEFTEAGKFFRSLRELLALCPSRFVFVPGNHDVCWEASQISELNLRMGVSGDVDETALRKQIDQVKLNHYKQFVSEFYGGDEFADRSHRSLERGAHVYDFLSLNLSLAAMNSCERESHRPDDHFGEVSQEQAQCIIDSWGSDYDGWLKVVAVHHNPVLTTDVNITQRTAMLQDRFSDELLQRYVADVTGLRGKEHLRSIVQQNVVQVLLHGHHHDMDYTPWPSKGDASTHVLSTGWLGLPPSTHLPDSSASCELILLALGRASPLLTAYRMVYDKAVQILGEASAGGFVLDAKHPGGYHRRLDMPGSGVRPTVCESVPSSPPEDTEGTKGPHGNVTITCKLNRNFDEYMRSGDASKFVEQLCQMGGIPPDAIKSVSFERGSVRITLGVERDRADDVFEAMQSPELRSLNIVESARSNDAFVAWNSLDRDEVTWVCEQLMMRGVKLWVDTTQGVFGSSLTKTLYEAIKTSKTALVFFGVRGLGGWEKHELATLVSLYVNRKIERLIPVLLPGTEKWPEGFVVEDLAAIRFSGSVDDPDVLDQLEYAVTGRDPRAKWDSFEIHVQLPSSGEGCFVATAYELDNPRYPLIVRAAATAGIKVLIGQESEQPNFFGDKMKSAIRAARVVVVDWSANQATGQVAPGVLYAWAMADALGKPTILFDNGTCALPFVASATRAVHYRDENLNADPDVQKRLTEAIRSVLASQHYPFLTDNDRDDIYASRTRFMCMRPAFWGRLRHIVLLGIHIHDAVRKVARCAHKLEQNIQRVCQDRDDIDSSDDRQLHERNWRYFKREYGKWYTHSQDAIRDLFDHLKSERKSVEDAFGFLVKNLPEPLNRLAKTSFAQFKNALARIEDYTASHVDLVEHTRSLGNNAETVGHLKRLCEGLSEHVDAVAHQVSEMIRTLLSVLAAQQKTLGGPPEAARGLEDAEGMA